MIFSNINIPAIKILRMLRTLRPLRFISHNINMKIVVTALMESMGALLNVIIVIFFIWYSKFINYFQDYVCYLRNVADRRKARIL